MDLRMPGIDGYQVTQKIRELPEGEAVKIIMISASAFDSNRQESLDAGSDDFIAKPFREAALLSLLQRHLNLRWIYDEQETLTTREAAQAPVDSESGSLVPPPAQDLVALLDLAKRGNINAILQYTDKLQQMDANFTPFAQQLRQLAKSFKIREIQAFVGQF